ncbi:MAG: acetylxylan esterase [Halanaerobiales bacterium]
MNLFDMPLEEMREYKPELSREAHFDSFWNQTIAASEKQELNVEITSVEYHVEQVKVYDLYFDGFKNSRIYGRYVLPAEASADNQVPAVVMFHGYNYNNVVVSNVLHYSLMGYAVLMLDVRGQNPKSPDHNDYENGGPSGWMTNGILNPYNYYYRFAYMDCVRAVEVISKREEIDSDRIAVEGGSQGGGLSLAAGALSDKVKVVMADIPYLCHFRRSVELYDGSPYDEIYHYFKVHDSLHKTEDQIYKTLSYFDCMNLAPMITGDVLISVGLEDTVCPPSTAFAAYNHLDTEKEIRVYPEYGHGGFNQHGEEKTEFLKKRFA